MIGRKRIRGHQCEFTNPYHNSRILGTTHWRFWFGLAWGYQLLPTRTYSRPGAFGLDTVPFTKAYQSPDLGLGLPCCTFTNHYHRGDTTHIGIHIVASIRHQGTGWAGWHRVITVDNVENRWEPSEVVVRWRVGIEKKIFFESGRSASKLMSMVVKLVGQ